MVVDEKGALSENQIQVLTLGDRSLLQLRKDLILRLSSHLVLKNGFIVENEISNLRILMSSKIFLPKICTYNDSRVEFVLYICRDECSADP